MMVDSSLVRPSPGIRRKESNMKDKHYRNEIDLGFIVIKYDDKPSWWQKIILDFFFGRY